MKIFFEVGKKKEVKDVEKNGKPQNLKERGRENENEERIMVTACYLFTSLCMTMVVESLTVTGIFISHSE